MDEMEWILLESNKNYPLLMKKQTGRDYILLTEDTQWILNKANKVKATQKINHQPRSQLQRKNMNSLRPGKLVDFWSRIKRFINSLDDFPIGKNFDLTVWPDQRLAKSDRDDNSSYETEWKYDTSFELILDQQDAMKQKSPMRHASGNIDNKLS